MISAGESSSTREVNWFGDLPPSWAISRLSRVAASGSNTFIDGDWIESRFITDIGIRLLQTGNVGIGSFKEQGFRYVSQETFASLRCAEVFPGDVLICRLAGPVGRACLAPPLSERMITSVDVCILKCSAEWSTKLVVYVLSSDAYLDYMQSVCRGGTRDRVSRSFLGTVPIPQPSLSEQYGIVDFLDREIAKIDVLTAEQRRLIELLKEKRQAVISHAVTKGLNPDALMKDSSIEWLGEVPAHWRVATLRRSASAIKTGGTPPPASFTNEGVPWYTPSGFGAEFKLLSADRYVGEEQLVRSGVEIYPSGSLLIVSIGSIGRVAVSEQRVATNQQINAVLLNGHADGRFLAYFINAFERVMQSRAPISLLPILNQSRLAEFPITLPDHHEQEAIVIYLDAKAAQLLQLILASESSISLLHERRSALISAAVTGKIDVRGLVPDDVREAVPA